MIPVSQLELDPCNGSNPRGLSFPNSKTKHLAAPRRRRRRPSSQWTPHLYSPYNDGRGKNCSIYGHGNEITIESAFILTLSAFYEQQDELLLGSAAFSRCHIMRKSCNSDEYKLDRSEGRSRKEYYQYEISFRGNNYFLFFCGRKCRLQILLSLLFSRAEQFPPFYFTYIHSYVHSFES